MKSTGINQASPLKRRGMLLGAGVAGAAALVAKSLPVAPSDAVPASAQPVADAAGGYQVTQHVLRYYETAKV